MYIDIYDIVLLIPLMLLLMYWWRTSGQKDVAVHAARAYCKERSLQFLDETLVFQRYRVERDARNQRRLCRIYAFDYCPDGVNRLSGEIIVRGYKVLRVILHADVLEITDYGN